MQKKNAKPKAEKMQLRLKGGEKAHIRTPETSDLKEEEKQQTVLFLNRERKSSNMESAWGGQDEYASTGVRLPKNTNRRQGGRRR